MQLKTLLNRVQKHKGFVYGRVQLLSGSLVVEPPRIPKEFLAVINPFSGLVSSTPRSKRSACAQPPPAGGLSVGRRKAIAPTHPTTGCPPIGQEPTGHEQAGASSTDARARWADGRRHSSNKRQHRCPPQSMDRRPRRAILLKTETSRPCGAAPVRPRDGSRCAPCPPPPARGASHLRLRPGCPPLPGSVQWSSRRQRVKL